MGHGPRMNLIKEADRVNSLLVEWRVMVSERFKNKKRDLRLYTLSKVSMALVPGLYDSVLGHISENDFHKIHKEFNYSIYID